MSTESQILITAVKNGEMTDPGGMTTTQDITHVVEGSYDAVKQQLHALANQDLIVGRTFGREEVWSVPNKHKETPVGTPMPTSTRDPHARK